MNLVKPRGAAPARVMIVNDYPTIAESETGVVSDNYDFLRKLLRNSGISVQNCWHTHYYKSPVKGYSFAKPSDREVIIRNMDKTAPWDDLIRREIDAIQPNIIIAMGELALRGLTKQTNVHKRAGSFYTLKQELLISKPTRVLASLSQRDVHSDLKQFLVVQSDLSKARPWVEIAKPLQDDFTLYVNKQPGYIKDWLAHFSKGAKFGVYDVETSKNIVTCICFCFDGNNSLSVPITDRNLSMSDLGSIWYSVYYMLCGNIPWVNQNIAYDINRLEAMKFKTGRTLGDTMLRASILHPELPKGLDFLTRLHTTVGYYKDEGKEYDPKIHDFSRMMLYNAKDGIATHRVYTEQQKHLDAQGLNPINDNLHRSFFIYREMGEVGFRIDDAARKDLINFYSNTIGLLEAELNVIAGRRINANSSDQIGAFLIEIGAPKRIATWNEEKGKMTYKTGKVELEDMYVNVAEIGFLAHVVKLILAIRKLHKLRQFCHVVCHIDPRTGDPILRTSFKLTGTKTGRTATGELLESIYYQLHNKKKPEWTQPGISFQQIPKHSWQHDGRWYGKELRKMYVPRRGKRFCEFDKSQAEARVVDVLAENYESLEEYGKIDKHLKTTSIIDDVPYDVLFKAREAGDVLTEIRRQFGKTVKHAFNYYESAFSLSRRAHVPMKDSQHALDALNKSDPKTSTVFRATVKRNIETYRKLVTPYGRPRTFLGPITEKMLKEAYAQIPQSTVPDHMRFDIMNPMREEVRAYADYILEWHDSLLAEVTIGREEEYFANVKKYAATPIKFTQGTFIRNYELVIPIDCGSGDSWYEMKKYVI